MVICLQALSADPQYYKLLSFVPPPRTLVPDLLTSCRYLCKIVPVFFVFSCRFLYGLLFIFIIHLPYPFFVLILILQVFFVVFIILIFLLVLVSWLEPLILFTFFLRLFFLNLTFSLKQGLIPLRLSFILKFLFSKNFQEILILFHPSWIYCC